MKPGWFGPKRAGFGISPRSWQGWLVTALFIAGLAAAMRWLRPALETATGLSMPLVTGLMIAVWLLAMAGVVALTYDGAKH